MKYAVLFKNNEQYATMRALYMREHLNFLSRRADSILAAGPLKRANTGDGAGGL